MSSAAALRRVGRGKCVEGGLEFPSKLTYQNWEPGGEYTQPLVMKNIKLSTQRIKFKISSNQFSSPTCHQPLILCAGTSYTLPVTFRPCGKNPCEEFIQFETSEGKIIKIPIKAVLSRPKLAITEHLKFGMCAVTGCISINFEIVNIGSVQTYYSWKCPQGFSILPKHGNLTPKEKCGVNATFCPVSAKVYADFAECSYSTKENIDDLRAADCDEMLYTKVMRLEGIGKFPYVTVYNYSELPRKQCSINPNTRPLTVQFGSVAVGDSVEKFITVENPSPVFCTFLVQPSSGEHPRSPFVCPNSEKGLHPHNSAKVKLVYSPKVLCECSDIGYFTVQAQGGCGVEKIKCIGQAVGPNVCIENENNIVNFGNLECGKVSTGLVHLKNKSAVAAVFQLQICDSSVFCCDVVSGHLAPKMGTSVAVKFIPQRPIPYCRMVSLLIQNQEPIFVTFIGTGYSEIQMPAPLLPKDILNYFIHAESGISLLPPERLKELLDNGILMTDQPGDVLKLSQSILSLPTPKHIVHQSSYAKYLHSESELSSVCHVSCDINSAEFGYCAPTLSSDGKVVTISNHTYGEICCIWMIANVKSFEILPSERTILPRKSASFTVYFKPEKSNHFYDIEIECYMFYKDLCDYSHVNSATITPSWCLTLHVSGHTFSKDFGVSIPESSFDTEDVMFPATTVGQAVCQTVAVQNVGNEPTLYSIHEGYDKTFRLKPTHGILKDFQLVVFEMVPRDAKLYSSIIKYQLNSTASVHFKNLVLHGSGEYPKITLENKGQLYFKPTCIGCKTFQNYTIRNSSGIPLRFEWQHSNSKSKKFDVEPASGVILPYEIQEHRWVFSPSEPIDYELKSVLHSSLMNAASEIAASSRVKSRGIVDVFGTGATGCIKCTPTSCDFGVMIVGISKYCHLSLSNSGTCDLKYILYVYNENGEATAGDVVELSHTEGFVYSQSSVHVKVTVRPCHSEIYSCRIKYALLSTHNEDNAVHGDSTINQYDLCQIKFIGVYPSMKIVDIQGEGVASQISKASLWKMLSISKINESLSDAPLTSELRYTIGSRHSLRPKLPVKARTIFDCDFGAAPLNAENCIIHLVLKNDGAVSTEWAFLMSSDVWLEPEFWADFGELDEVEKNEMFILTNELFTISPKKGCLDPGSHVSITLTHKHSHTGTSKLPILLKINNGRELVLNLIGVTVDKGHPYLHIGCKEHIFDPVPIGIHSYPRQVLPLYNGGDSIVGYKVDVAVLNHLTAENHCMPVFECLQPTGNILPGRTLPLEFIFSPIEAKKYAVEVPIHLSTGDTSIVTLVGEGFNHRHEMASTKHPKLDSTYPGSMCPRDLAILSHENLHFGRVPQFSIAHRIVFIKNMSQHTLSFCWEKDVEEVISVEPTEGFIQPRKCSACKVIFCSHDLSCNYNFDQICKITDESELSSHQAALRKWNEKNEDEKYALVITEDSDLTQSKKSAKERVPTYFSSKFGVLPPIGEPQQSYEEWKRSDLSTKSKKRPINKKTVDKGPPVPPTPISLHLHITAETTLLSDYVTLYGDLCKFHIDNHELALRNSSMCCVQEDVLDFQKFILNQIIKEILGDSNFYEALRQIANEPTPYFSQFSSSRTVKAESKVDTAIPVYTAGSTAHQNVCNVSDKSVPRTSEVHQDSEMLSSSSDDYRSRTPLANNIDEISSVVESTIHNTLLNIFIEANMDEFSIDRPLCAVTKSTVEK